jgi:hypothetical protein
MREKAPYIIDAQVGWFGPISTGKFGPQKREYCHIADGFFLLKIKAWAPE